MTSFAVPTMPAASILFILSDCVDVRRDNMEKFWQRCMYQYLRADPEEHYVLLVGAISLSSISV